MRGGERELIPEHGLIHSKANQQTRVWMGNIPVFKLEHSTCHTFATTHTVYVIWVLVEEANGTQAWEMGGATCPLLPSTFACQHVPMASEDECIDSVHKTFLAAEAVFSAPLGKVDMLFHS